MISVVIPLFNKQNTIVNTINSVINQTFKNFEVIVVNDGSTDDSVFRIQNKFDDVRMRIIHQVNQGVSVARNRGVLEARYDCIAFIDGDDLWMPNYLQMVVKAMQDFPQCGMYCSAGLVRNPEGDYLRLSNKHKSKICEIDFFQNPHVFVHTSAVVMRKSLFKTVGGFPVGMKRNQDYALFYSAALLTTVVYVGYPLSIYPKHRPLKKRV